MNYNKVIKDLKERNDKLQEQYRLRDIRCIHLEYENEMLKNDFETQHELTKKYAEENQELKKQLDYLRSGEYYNQLRFENEMLQQVVDTNGVPSEVYDYIDCTHRNTELLKENQELKRQLENYKKLGFKYLQDNNNNLETQQKEFIEYLEDLIKQNETVVEVSKYGLPKNCSKLLIDFYKEILSKYKSIIGGKE